MLAHNKAESPAGKPSAPKKADVLSPGKQPKYIPRQGDKSNTTSPWICGKRNKDVFAEMRKQIEGGEA